MPVPYSEIFPLASELGFDGVELGWQRPSQIHSDGDLSNERRQRLYSEAVSAGIQIPSVAAGFVRKGDLIHRDHLRRRSAATTLLKGVDLCADLHAGVLLLPFFLKGELKDGTAVDRLVDQIRALVPRAESRGVTIGIECSLPAPKLAKLLDRLNSPSVKAYWDMGNTVSLGRDPVQELKVLGRRVAQVHVKEFLGTPSLEQAGCSAGINSVPLGEGAVPLAHVLRTLRGIGYDGWLVLETGVFGEGRQAIVSSAASALLALRAALLSQ
jgi:sugar phosphate isomerase/epimerase